MKKYIRLYRMKFVRFLNKNKLPFLISLILWWIVDFNRKRRYKESAKPHLYGIYGFFGLPGHGKTMALSWELSELRNKYGNDIYIFTNYGFNLEDKPFDDWRMLLEEYDKPAIFAWDEVQNEFNSRDFKKFPVELLTLLTQNRKGHGKRVYYTAQRWNRVDKVFRELTTQCAECKSRIPRMTSARWYSWEEYEQLISTTNVESKVRIKHKSRDIFVQTDKIRNSYDSYQMLDSAKSKDYLDREELAKLVHSTN